jgi:hypothetical protein
MMLQLGLFCTHCWTRGVSLCATFALGLFVFGVSSATAQPNFLFFGFEVDEELTANTYGGANSTDGLDGAGFGITQGSSAFVINNATAQCCTIINSSVSSGSTGESLNNFNAASAAAIAMESSPGRFYFDFGYDVSDVPANAYAQIGIVINSDAGYDNTIGFGKLLTGNVGPTGNFPVLGTAANDGATMEILDSSDFAAGDYKGLVRVSMPIGAAPLLKFGTGGDGVLNFAQVGFSVNGGWAGSMKMSFDNVGFQVNVVPEPATCSLLSLTLAGLLMRRRVL